ncbi:11994_t:CDS:2 [Diversispora eburnea]|uniref:11994_t:CDS:1 n=1 Tax=Diversispora eburnea TaxID=1213867 RepID=A0A9N8ZI00_9GLOM|nr:11994_t:CDS:2 [Diversispora eburnea]
MEKQRNIFQFYDSPPLHLHSSQTSQQHNIPTPNLSPRVHSTDQIHVSRPEIQPISFFPSQNLSLPTTSENQLHLHQQYDHNNVKANVTVNNTHRNQNFQLIQSIVNQPPPSFNPINPINPINQPTNTINTIRHLSLSANSNINYNQNNPSVNTTTQAVTEEERHRRRLDRNRIAARQCRERKKAYVTNLESRVTSLEAENTKLRQELTTLHSRLQYCPVDVQESMRLYMLVEDLKEKEQKYTRPISLVEFQNQLGENYCTLQELVTEEVIIERKFDLCDSVSDTVTLYLFKALKRKSSQDVNPRNEPKIDSQKVGNLIQSLQNQLRLLNEEETALKNQLKENIEIHNALDEHYRRLHEYNGIKDVGQMLFGKCAEIEGTTIKEMYERFGVGLKD